jgi:hypothetical protein
MSRTSGPEANGHPSQTGRLQVKFVREGDPDARRLHDFLIDEPDAAAALEEEQPGLEAARLGFSGWLRHIESAVVTTLAAKR